MELHIGARVTLAQTEKEGRVIKIDNARKVVHVRTDEGELVKVKTWAIESIQESC